MMEDRSVKNRIPWIDNIKALAIILVIIGHVCSIGVQEKYICNILYYIIYMFHMPLFFVISGINYSIRKKPISPIVLLDFCVPIIIFAGGVAYLLNPTWDIFNRYRMVWFLAVLLYIYLLKILFKDSKIINIIHLFSFFALGIGQYFFYCIYGENHLYKLLSEVAMYMGYFICFEVGNIISTECVIHRKSIILCVLSAMVIMFIQRRMLFQSCVMKVLCGLCCTVVLIGIFKRINKCSKIMTWLSKYSLEIYLLHINIIHNEIVTGVLKRYNDHLYLYIIVLILDIFIPYCYILLEKRITLLKFIMHPRKTIFEKQHFSLA